MQANLSKDPEDDDLIGSFVKPVAGVMLEAAHSVRMVRCRLSKMGSAGIDIGEGCRRLSIVGCHLHDLSGSGIQVGGFRISDAHPSDPRAVVKEIEIANNYLHGIGEEYRGSIGSLVRESWETGFTITVVEIREFRAVRRATAWTKITLISSPTIRDFHAAAPIEPDLNLPTGICSIHGFRPTAESFLLLAWP